MIGAGIETVLGLEDLYDLRRVTTLSDAAAAAASWPADVALVDGVLLEGRAIATNISGIRTAYDSQIRQALAGIVGSDAQHLVLLRQLRHEQPVPSAFERGAA